MSRPGSGYYTKAGERVPSVTEVLSKFKNADPLISWAFSKGYASGQAAAKGLPAPRSAYAEKEEAAQAGTIAHAMLEAYVTKTEYVYDGKRPPPGVMEQGRKGFEAGKLWLNDTGLEIVSTEQSLVSEKYKFGGTYDIKLRRRNTTAVRVGDFKTSRKIYADYLIQVAAYGILIEECEGDAVEGYDILRFSKEHADWDHKYFTDLKEARMAFLYMLKLLPLVSALEERVL